MLTASEIKFRKQCGDIVIEPWDEKNLNPNSYNITLANELLVYDLEDGQPLDCKADNKTKKLIIPEEGLVLEPGVLYLGSTKEYTETRYLIPCIDGRSSIGRLGIEIHITAGFGDIGFRGVWTLEITVVHPIRIYPDLQIGQLYYEEPDGSISLEYSGKYQDSQTVKSSGLYKEYNN